MGAALQKQPLGLTLESRLRHVPPPAPRPSPRGCLRRGTALGPVDPPLSRVPGAHLLLCLLRPWWRVSGSAGRCLGSLSSPSWCIIYLKCTHLVGLLTNFACVYMCVTSTKVTTRNVPGPASGPRTPALHPYPGRQADLTPAWTRGGPPPAGSPWSGRCPGTSACLCVGVCELSRPGGERPGSITDLRLRPVAALAQGHQPCARGGVGQGRGPCACVLGDAGLLSTPHGVHILISVLQGVQGGPFLLPLLTSLLEGVGVNKVNRCTNFK